MAVPAIKTLSSQQSEVLFSSDNLKVSIRIPAEIEYIYNAIATLRGICEHLAFSEAKTNRITLALEETLLNSIQHAYPLGDGVVDIEFSVDSQVFTLTVQDYGRGLPPNAEKPLNTVEEILRSNGRGLPILKALPDKLIIDSPQNSHGTRTTMLFYLMKCV